MDKYKLLPLGSIVYLNDGTKKVMIIARGLITNMGGQTVFFDYGGVPYPEGLQDDQMAYFQHEGIDNVVFEGYTDIDNDMTVKKIFGYLERHPEIKKGDVKQLRKM